MENTLLTKMKVKPGYSALVINPPRDYPKGENISWLKEGQADFVHLFVAGKEEFEALFTKALSHVKEEGLFWLSYPKGKGKAKPDINRDSLWDLVLPRGYHPVAQVALNDTWSALRLKKNEQGKEYLRPNSKKGGI